ncbi:uncharacterized protein LOC123896581 [Trifolium pratense]|uniref:uncharacterized protein LOC123896544 n=1 Tax=Trifolium pratense TaxID=57577 RepID=UPI0008448F04|nr:uncharacterized protein LOC123896544 [Trifolium pratense]XP_045802908.1 uncharacterized protein LOC123896581 [Trifolium pratense]
MAKKNLKVCLGVSAIFFIILAIITITLIFTVFKPKDPNIVVHIAPYNFLSPDIAPNITLPLVITMGNPNYGSFKFNNGFSYIHYHETIVGIVPIGSHLVPPRSQLNVSTNANFMVGKLIENPLFLAELPGMKFTMVSKAELPGKVIILKFIKVKSMVYNSCDISVNMTSNNVESNCQSKLKMFT